MPFTEQKTAVEDMLCNPYIQTDKKYSFVQIPLFYNESLYGVLLCDLTNEIFENGEFLVNQMSSPTRIIKLLKVNETIQQQLEESFEAMRENNVVLDTLSKSDGLTMTLNRRGFYQEAEKMLTEARESRKPLLVLYADMNNLKIINDRYGHENGDFSLKMIGRLLAEQIGKKAWQDVSAEMNLPGCYIMMSQMAEKVSCGHCVRHLSVRTKTVISHTM